MIQKRRVFFERLKNYKGKIYYKVWNGHTRKNSLDQGRIHLRELHRAEMGGEQLQRPRHARDVQTRIQVPEGREGLRERKVGKLDG